MRVRLSTQEFQVLELLDDHPAGLHADQISSSLQGVVNPDIQELLNKGFLEKAKDGRIRTLGRLT